MEAEWEREQIDALFDDLDQGAQVRSTVEGSTTDQAVTLRQAQELLNCGAAQAIQIRYEFEQEFWCDTLMVGVETVRVIRRNLGPRT